MQASQDRKLDYIKGQIEDQEPKLDCVINELKSEMEHKMESMEEKVYH